MRMWALGLVAALAGGTAAVGQGKRPQLTVTFTESAPADLFRIANDSPCDVVLRELTIDLAGSRGDLIFDTEAGGAGLQAWAPFELADGAVSAVTAVGDGDRTLTLTFTGLRRGDTATFAIDPSGTTRRVSASFGPDAQARLAAAECAVS
jgi:hypothetical protein